MHPQAGASSDREPAPFARVGLVGLGLIGGSIALAARRRWPSVLVVGVDRREVLERAMRRHAIDVGADDLGMLKEVDVVVLATPVERIVTLLGELDAWVAGEATVTDTGSTKRGIVAASHRLPPRFRFVGGHPLAGAAHGGIDHARPDLFEGRPWVLVPPADNPIDAIERVERFVRGLGATPVRLDAETHDRLLAAVSHLPQVVASALMQVVGDTVGADGLGLAGPGLEDTTRLASSPVDLWVEICRSNADYLGEALDRTIAVLRDLRRDLAQAQPGAALRRVLASANAWKAELDRATRRERS